ncbi:MAG: hypothetical protein ACE5F5_11805 [Acidimicrobiia bacterium]
MLHTDSDRPAIYQSEGVWYYRASALGGCINELVFLAKGEQPAEKSDYIQQVLQAGQDWEGPVRERLASDAGYEITPGEPAILEVAPGHVVVGNTDGKAIDGDEVLGVEIKTLGEESFGDFCRSGLDKFPEYQWQLSCYMHATGLPWLYAAAPRLRSKDEDGNWEFDIDLDQIHVLPVITEAPIPLSRIRRKVRRINTLVEMDPADLPPCEKAKFCSMSRFHDLIGGRLDAEEAEQVPAEDELYTLLLLRQSWKDKEDEARRKRREIDDKLKLLMEGPATIEGVGRWVPVLKPGRVTLDRSQLALDLGEEIAKYEKQGQPYQEIRFYREKT